MPQGGILVGVYALLLEKRASYRICRVYLVVTTLLATVVPLLHIPIWPATAAYPVGQATVGTFTAAILSDTGGHVTLPVIITGIWVAGILILGSRLYRQIRKIQALRRKSPRTTVAGYSIVRVQQPIGSFSFLRTIYLQEGILEPQQAHIIAHEANHIRHRHTCERIVMEGMIILFWWNPFIRIAARKLIEVMNSKPTATCCARVSALPPTQPPFYSFSVIIRISPTGCTTL